MSNADKPLKLEEGFYEFSDTLRYIRDEAIYRMIAPDALLFSLLARVSASIPPSWVLPNFTGSYGTPSLCVAIVGRAGIGKSQANSAARELLAFSHDEYRFDLSSGTGQGMIESYLYPARKGEAGYEEGRKIQRYLGQHFYIDEGSTLIAAATKKEDITADTIRSLWSGETVGQTNASATTSRYLPARSASFGLGVGFQPDIAATFVTLGAGVGTPQRFLWSYASNRDQPDYAPEPKGRIHSALLQHSADQIKVFGFDPSIGLEIRLTRAAIMREHVTIDPLETHDKLKQMKVAACLARLEGETVVDTQRWELAGMIIEVSKNVLHDIRDKGREAEQAIREERSDHKAESVLRIAEKTRDQAIKAGAACMGRKLHKEVKALTFSELSQAVSSDDRKRSSAEEMIGLLLRQGWGEEISNNNGKTAYKAGRETPPPASR